MKNFTFIINDYDFSMWNHRFKVQKIVAKTVVWSSEYKSYKTGCLYPCLLVLVSLYISNTKQVPNLIKSSHTNYVWYFKPITTACNPQAISCNKIGDKLQNKKMCLARSATIRKITSWFRFLIIQSYSAS